MKLYVFTAGLLISLTGCSQQQSNQKQSTKSPVNEPEKGAVKAGGSCEGCGAIYESPVPFGQLNETDTLPGYDEAGPKLLISGTIFQADGKTPAPDVVLYIYHTNQQGNYVSKSGEGWEKRHGYIRGWVKTNEKGEYSFYTLRPASYPNSKAPQHIHPVIKEPGISDYYIDEFLFDDDPNLTATDRGRQEERGGNGIITLTSGNGMLYGKRDIILGKNIPGYPSK